jgi:Skp family chaperone for outer membrane proteins
MRGIAFVGVTIVLALYTMAPAAEEAKGLKIGYVDLDQVAQKAKIIRTVVSTVESDLKKQQDEIDAKLERYRVLRDSLAKQDTILTEDEKETRRKELRDLKNEIDDLQYQVNKELRRSEREMIDPAVDKIMKAISDVGKEKGYDLILRSEFVLYGKDSHDITGEIVDKLNAESIEKKAEGEEKKPEVGEKKSEGQPEKKDAATKKNPSAEF